MYFGGDLDPLEGRDMFEKAFFDLCQFLGCTEFVWSLFDSVIR